MYINNNHLEDKVSSYRLLVISKVTHNYKGLNLHSFHFQENRKNHLWNFAHGKVLYLIWSAYDTQLY